MKVLLYGFKPYMKWNENITMKILDLVEDRKDLKKRVFDVEFAREQFILEIEEFEPEIVIGMGQHPRARKIRIERRTVNLKRNSKEEPPTPISKNGPPYYHTSLKLKKVPGSTITYDAGKYVCNYSMYVISEYLAGKRTGFAFLHVPMNLDVRNGVEFVENVLEQYL